MASAPEWWLSAAAPGLPPRAAGQAPTRRAEKPSPAPAHPRPGLAGPAVIQRRHVRAAAPSLLPPPSPRAWQETRATWSGNKGPRGPRGCLPPHSRPGTPMQPGVSSPPTRTGPGRSHVGESRPAQTHTLGIGSDSGNRDSRVLLPAVHPAWHRPRTGTCGSSLCSSFLRGCWPPPEAANDPATVAAPEAKGSQGSGLLPTECGGGSRVSPPRVGTPVHLSARIPAAPSFSPPLLMGTGIITWFISEEMEKLISGASKGSSRKRAGPGPTESVSRPRRGKRSSGRIRGQSTEVARRTEHHRVFAGTRPLAHSLAGTAALKQQAEKLCPAVPSNWPPRASQRHCRNRGPLAPYPLARHHVRRRQRLAGASGTKLSANHRRAPERMRPEAPPTPCPAPPRLSPSLSPVPSSTAQVGQRKVIPGRETGPWVHLRLLPAPSRRPFRPSGN